MTPRFLDPQETAMDHQPLITRRALLGAAALAPATLASRAARAAGGVTELIVPAAVTPWLPAYQKVAAQYQREKGVKITFRTFPYAGLRTQIVNSIQSGNAVFDLYQLDEPATGEFYDNGWVRPLDDIIPGFTFGPGVVRYADLPFWNKAERRFTQSGKVMSVPINGNVDLLVYRKDLYDKLGLAPPRTSDEAIANGQRAQSEGLAKYGYVTRGQATTGGAAVSYDFEPVFYSYGGDWFEGTGANFRPVVNSEAAKAGAAAFRRLLELGPARPQTVGQADVISLFQSGQAFQGHFVAAGASQLEDPARSSVVSKCGFAVVPAGSTGKPAPTSGTWSLCVPANQTEERQKAAADFLVWMIAKEQQTAFAQAGGIPVRDDLDFDALGPAAGWLKPVAASTPFIRSPIRYVFAAAMLEAVEPVLAQIGAGDVPPGEGLDRLEAKLASIAKAAGFPPS